MRTGFVADRELTGRSRRVFGLRNSGRRSGTERRSSAQRRRVFLWDRRRSDERRVPAARRRLGRQRWQGSGPRRGGRTASATRLTRLARLPLSHRFLVKRRARAHACRRIRSGALSFTRDELVNVHAGTLATSPRGFVCSAPSTVEAEFGSQFRIPQIDEAVQELALSCRRAPDELRCGFGQFDTCRAAIA